VPGQEEPGEVLSLWVAAVIAYRSLVGEDLEEEEAREPARLEAHLDYLAAELASILPLFAPIQGGALEILPPEQVARGRFSKGGKLLHLPEMREPVAAPCVRHADLLIAIEQLRQRLSPSRS
jgi:hypothetical protein